jgi:hypothetical protein
MNSGLIKPHKSKDVNILYIPLHSDADTYPYHPSPLPLILLLSHYVICPEREVVVVVIFSPNCVLARTQPCRAVEPRHVPLYPSAIRSDRAYLGDSLTKGFGGCARLTLNVDKKRAGMMIETSG